MRMTKLQGVLALCQAFPVVSHWIVKVLKEVDGGPTPFYR